MPLRRCEACRATDGAYSGHKKPPNYRRPVNYFNTYSTYSVNPTTSAPIHHCCRFVKAKHLAFLRIIFLGQFFALRFLLLISVHHQCGQEHQTSLCAGFFPKKTPQNSALISKWGRVVDSVDKNPFSST